MVVIKKILNNNAILAFDIEKKKEVIFLGKGVGFNKKIAMTDETPPGIKKYYLDKDTEKGLSADLIKNVAPIYLEIAHEIIKTAEVKFEQLDNHILLPLADHIAFAIERIEGHINFENPFTNDIRFLYEQEFEVALKGKAVITEKTGYTISDDDVGYIALYIHSAISDTKVSQSMNVAIIMGEAIKQIENDCSMTIKVGSFAYSRLMYHFRFMISRVMTNEKLNSDMIEYTKNHCPYAFEVAAGVCQKLEQELGKPFSEREVSYLALHIERIRMIEGSSLES
ncbi:PRD domain-containing protein [Acetobacterium paludosum]|uniref:PRD domain-containing protein n=1 Tax=Acetobacterium paludosum TaxID=52693 RepID=A0A923HWS5_9FIRM|nr:PRD domain-containing protein [Acetobacterium paludosum]MBC3888597.1 PRD domain-containing protein [Acetobacterium paludosum]